ncbi:MAG: GAF domain-containing protein [Chloroflexi bacterium]|nr:GAF domain-containing protein [Chloroflexota bacterium]
MDDNQQSSAEVLDNSIQRLEKDIRQIEEVLSVLYQTFADKGIQPSYHLNKAVDKLRSTSQRISDSGSVLITESNQLGELVKTTAIITQSLSLEEVLEALMDTVVSLTGAQRAYLMLYNERHNLEVRAARNWQEETIPSDEVQFSRTIINEALESGHAIITTNAISDDRYTNSESIMVQQLRSIVCIPLKLVGKNVGVLYADNRLREAVFHERGVPILTAFGTQAAIAIENAQIFGRVQDELAQAKRELVRLRIQVDPDNITQQVSEITDSEYFRALESLARQVRERKRDREQDEPPKD